MKIVKLFWYIRELEEFKMRNHEVLTAQKLLKNGQIAEPGWSRKMIQEYDRKDIKAPKWRIKEWDYYIIVDNDGYAFTTTIADNRYMGLINSNFFDFNISENMRVKITPRTTPRSVVAKLNFFIIVLVQLLYLPA